MMAWTKTKFPSVKQLLSKLPDGEEEEYTIVGSAEADPFSGKISNDSPIAQALIGKQLGDQVIIATPGGDMTVKITKVEAN